MIENKLKKSRGKEMRKNKVNREKARKEEKMRKRRRISVKMIK